MPRSKKPKPTFDIARAEVDRSGAGWVYRSDLPPAVPDLTAASEPSRPSAIDGPAPRGRGPEAAAKQAAQASAAPQESSRKAPSWIATGVGVMVFPLTLAVVMMAAPVIWMLSGRDRTR